MSMNKEELMEKLAEIGEKLDDILSVIETVEENLPSSPYNYYVESKLGTIIDLLNRILDNM